MYWTIIIIIIVLLLAHHIFTHPQYDFPNRAFQITDVMNHETWIIAAISFGLGTTMC